MIMKEMEASILFLPFAEVSNRIRAMSASEFDPPEGPGDLRRDAHANVADALEVEHIDLERIIDYAEKWNRFKKIFEEHHLPPPKQEQS